MFIIDLPLFSLKSLSQCLLDSTKLIFCVFLFIVLILVWAEYIFVSPYILSPTNKWHFKPKIPSVNITKGSYCLKKKKTKRLIT